MPTTARSLASTTVSHPAARMRSPPTPKKEIESGAEDEFVEEELVEEKFVGTAALGCPAERSSAGFRSAALRKASISCAPYISPEASPADMSTFTWPLYESLRAGAPKRAN